MNKRNHKHPLLPRCGLCLVILCQIAMPQAQADVEPDVVASIIANTVSATYQPAFTRFADATVKLDASTQALCEKPAAAAVEQVRDDYRGVVSAFAAVELFRIGPLLDENRQNRLFYWPDKRRVGERQLRSLLAEPGSKSLTLDQLEGKSVALQGLPALERLLFAKHSAEQLLLATQPDCHVAMVIVDNMHAMALALQQGWSDESELTQELLNPQPDASHFRSEDEVLRSLVTQIIAGTEFVLDKKIAPLVGDKARIKRAPLWLSEQTMPMIAANLEALRILIIDSGLAGQAELERELSFEFRTVASMLDSLLALPSLTNEQGQISDEAQSFLRTLQAVTGGIRTTLNERFTQALGMNPGFNSGDGD